MEKSTESPVVMFTNYKRVDGFEVSLTLRGDNLKVVATELDNAIKLIAGKGGTPVVRGAYQKKEAKPIEYIEGRVCPTDGARIVKGEGKVKEKCERYKYDFAVKKNVGDCNYIVWV